MQAQGSHQKLRQFQPQSVPVQSSINGSVRGSTSASTNANSTPGSYRKRRPIYVGAGYSSQAARRRRMNAVIDADSRLRRSQSDSHVSDLVDDQAQSSVAAGKRRRVEADDDDDAPPPFSNVSADSVQPSPAPKSSIRSSATSNNLNSLSRPSAPVATPARPSPLWQVSKADTPSPSPPKKPSQPDVSIRVPTRAADLMMDIIREEDSARPVSLLSAITGCLQLTDQFSRRRKFCVKRSLILTKVSIIQLLEFREVDLRGL